MHIDALGEISHDPLAKAGAIMLVVIAGLALFAPCFPITLPMTTPAIYSARPIETIH